MSEPGRPGQYGESGYSNYKPGRLRPTFGWLWFVIPFAGIIGIGLLIRWLGAG